MSPVIGELQGGQRLADETAWQTGFEYNHPSAGGSVQLLPLTGRTVFIFDFVL